MSGISARTDGGRVCHVMWEHCKDGRYCTGRLVGGQVGKVSCTA